VQFSFEQSHAFVRSLKRLLAFSLLLLPVLGHCWGSEGHQVVALIAQSRLTSAAQAEVGRLLALEPGATLSSVSTWADEHRNPATAKWHYVNFPRGNCEFDAVRDCPDGHCVVAAINRQTQILGSATSDEHKLQALKFLVHFWGDIHQPLHAGFLDDKGGNTYQLQAFMRGSNLHAVWDTGLIHYLNESPEHLATRLQAVVDGLPISNLDPVNAAQESCGLVSLAGFYPDRLVDVAYISRYTPVMERRLATAGGRLAGALNQLFK